MQSGERKLHLRLNPGRTQHLAVASLLDDPLQQRSFTHAALAAQHKNSAPTRPDIVDKLSERTRFRVPPDQPDGTHCRIRAPVRIRRSYTADQP
jgi:hypothetical protein